VDLETEPAGSAIDRLQWTAAALAGAVCLVLKEGIIPSTPLVHRAKARLSLGTEESSICGHKASTLQSVAAHLA